MWLIFIPSSSFSLCLFLTSPLSRGSMFPLASFRISITWKKKSENELCSRCQFLILNGFNLPFSAGFHMTLWQVSPYVTVLYVIMNILNDNFQYRPHAVQTSVVVKWRITFLTSTCSHHCETGFSWPILQKFSPCSTRLIDAVLRAKSPICFTGKICRTENIDKICRILESTSSKFVLRGRQVIATCVTMETLKTWCFQCCASRTATDAGDSNRFSV